MTLTRGTPPCTPHMEVPPRDRQSTIFVPRGKALISIFFSCQPDTQLSLLKVLHNFKTFCMKKIVPIWVTSTMQCGHTIHIKWVRLINPPASKDIKARNLHEVRNKRSFEKVAAIKKKFKLGYFGSWQIKRKWLLAWSYTIFSVHKSVSVNCSQVVNLVSSIYILSVPSFEIQADIFKSLESISQAFRRVKYRNNSKNISRYYKRRSQ